MQAYMADLSYHGMGLRNILKEATAIARIVATFSQPGTDPILLL